MLAMQTLHALDLQVFYALHGLAGQSRVLDMLIVFCADYLAYILGLAFFGYLYLTKRLWKEKVEIFWAAVVTAFLARGVITEAIRFVYHRARPFAALNFVPLVQDSASSFPSGHSTFFYGLSMVVYFYDKRWGTWFFIATVIVTFARVAAGVHYPSDIVGGAIIGIVSAYIGRHLVRRYLGSRAN